MRADELQRLIDASPVHRALRLRVTGASETGASETGASETAAGQARVQLEAQTGPEHAGEDGSQYLHGGVVATLLDTAATFALIAATGADWGTVDLRVDFVRPAPAGQLLASARAAQVGRRLGRASAELTDPATGRLLASAVGTFTRTAPVPE